MEHYTYNINCTYTYTIEVCQQVFVYDGEAQFSSYASCDQMPGLPQSNFRDNWEDTLVSMII